MDGEPRMCRSTKTSMLPDGSCWLSNWQCQKCLLLHWRKDGGIRNQNCMQRQGRSQPHGSKNVVSRNKPLQNWMLEFFCSHGVEPCSANEDLAGSTDLAVCLPAGALALIDWKRSDKLRKGTRNTWPQATIPSKEDSHALHRSLAKILYIIYI